MDLDLGKLQIQLQELIDANAEFAREMLKKYTPVLEMIVKSLQRSVLKMLERKLEKEEMQAVKDLYIQPSDQV